MTRTTSHPLLTESLAEAVRRRGVFGEVRLEGSRLRCAARDSAAEAFYALEVVDGGLAVSLATADRWLSESIESDLMHHGDPLEELVSEELAELGVEVDPDSLVVRHYRSEDRLYTFLTPLSSGVSAELALTYLLAYEAAFRGLGDMTDDGEE